MSQATFLPGTIIGVWEVERKLGRGGMGSVYQCRNVHSRRIRAAIKLLDPVLQFHPEAKERFVREAEILFTIQHPHVVTVHNVHLDSPPYLEMEFVDGIALEKQLASGPASLAVTLRQATALADAVAYIHDKGIFHRDIKPDNILIRRDGLLKLVDFGLAVEKDGRQITQQGQARFGTVSYCPPEWMGKEKVDPAAWDRYALGVVLYEMLTGLEAFPHTPGREAPLQMLQIATRKASLACLDPGEPFQPALRELVRQLTARSPKDRPSPRTALEVLETLDPEWRQVTVPNVPRSDGLEGPPAQVDAINAEISLGPPSDPPEGLGEVGDKEIRRQDVAVSRSLRRFAWVPLLATGAFLVAAGLLLANIAILWLLVRPLPPRAVDVVVTGVDPSWAVSVGIEEVPEPSVSGVRHHFDAVPVGEAIVHWAIGEGCAPLTDSPWCGKGWQRVVVSGGQGIQSIVLDVHQPALRNLDVRVTRGPGSVEIGGVERRFDEAGSTSFEGLRPGRYEAHVRLGVCEADCSECGPDCVVAAIPVEVPAVGDIPVLDLELSAPIAVPEEVAVVVPPAPVRVRRPRAIPSRVGKTLAYGDAVAHCASRGGLLKVDAAPLKWSDAPMHEWRVGAGGKPMWRRMDGVVSTKVDFDQAHAHTGFRCAR